MKKLRNLVTGLVLGGISCFVLAGAVNGNHVFFRIGLAHAEEDWRKEFDEACSKTQDAMVLTSDELRSLVGRCDKLMPLLEKLDESQRKVYSKRLRSCRDLYLFVLESREKKQ